MPLGVDHTRAALMPRFIEDVRKPLMPLGVDHSPVAFTLSSRKAVRKPLMPLGVDHAINEIKINCMQRAKIFDAIRR